MKPLLLFFFIFSAFAFYIGEEDVKRFRTNQSIAESPGYAPAKFAELVKIEGRARIFRTSSESYYIKYTYQVNGVVHELRTTLTDQVGVAKYLSYPEPQAAYSTKQPSIATLKRYFDLRRKNETLGQVLTVVGLLSTLISLPISLLLSWRFGWLKRKNKE